MTKHPMQPETSQLLQLQCQPICQRTVREVVFPHNVGLVDFELLTWFHVFRGICLSLSLSLCLSASMSVCLYACLSLFLPVCSCLSHTVAVTCTQGHEFARLCHLRFVVVSGETTRSLNRSEDENCHVDDWVECGDVENKVQVNLSEN